MGNGSIRHTVFANERRQGARIDAAKTDDSAILEPRVKITLGPVIGRAGHRRMDDDTPHPGARREIACLDILVIGADVADVGKGKGNDLPRIGRIGEDFLIAGHRRIETDFANGRACRAEPSPFEHHAIGQYEKRGRARLPPKGKSVPLLVRHAHFRSIS